MQIKIATIEELTKELLKNKDREIKILAEAGARKTRLFQEENKNEKNNG